MSQKLYAKRGLVATVLCVWILLLFVPKVKGIDLPNYTFGVKEGDKNTYRVKIMKALMKDGTMQNDKGGYALYPYVTIHTGDTIRANTTSIFNGTLTYQLILFSKEGQKTPSYNIDYNRPSDITFPLEYHFISTTNTTLIEELAKTAYRGRLKVNLTADLIILKHSLSTLPEEESTHSVSESVYNRSTGWAMKVYHKSWNSTHTLYECLIEDEALYSEPSSRPVEAMFPSLFVLLAVVVYKKLKAKK